jgi:hypothetical protein
VDAVTHQGPSLVTHSTPHYEHFAHLVWKPIRTGRSLIPINAAPGSVICRSWSQWRKHGIA